MRSCARGTLRRMPCLLFCFARPRFSQPAFGEPRASKCELNCATSLFVFTLSAADKKALSRFCNRHFPLHACLAQNVVWKIAYDCAFVESHGINWISMSSLILHVSVVEKSFFDIRDYNYYHKYTAVITAMS